MPPLELVGQPELAIASGAEFYFDGVLRTFSELKVISHMMQMGKVLSCSSWRHCVKKLM
jgi:hypothetical protein